MQHTNYSTAFNTRHKFHLLWENICACLINCNNSLLGLDLGTLAVEEIMDIYRFDVKLRPCVEVMGSSGSDPLLLCSQNHGWSQQWLTAVIC